MINVSYEFIIELDTIIKIKSVDDVLDYIFCYISRFLCLKDATNIVNDIFNILNLLIIIFIFKNWLIIQN